MFIEDEMFRTMLAAFVRVARHVRNYPHPKLPIESLRRDAVLAEDYAEMLLGQKEYENITEIAFKDEQQ